MLTIENYYEAIRDAVRFYPSQGMRCLQPQTFVVLEATSNISMENLGKTPCDKGKPYFFSRLWKNLKYNPSAIKFDFPLVGAFELSSQTRDLFSRNGEQCYKIQILVADPYSENCDKGKCAGCDGRNGNEIFRDTEKILYNVLDYLVNCNVVRYDGNDRIFLHHQKVTDALIESGEATTYEIDQAATRSYNMALRQNNRDADVFRFSGKNGGGRTINDLYGTIINLNVCVNRCTTSLLPDVVLSNDSAIKDIGCCG